MFSKPTPRRPPETPEAVAGLGSKDTDNLINSKYVADSKEKAKKRKIGRNVLLFLLAFRLVNALSIQTFFQPDEYFQSLEPAWQMIFGAESGAWITWEWQHRLRSSIHPAIFAGVYGITSKLAELLHLAPSQTGELLVAAPKVLQAVSAALCDYYTAKLAEKLYGRDSDATWATLFLTVCSPWQWFCSSRTLSNCLETTWTIIALFFWPWHWFQGSQGEAGNQQARSTQKDIKSLRICLFFAAFASVLRPTNLLIWLCLSAFAVLDGLRLRPYWNPVAWVRGSSANPHETRKHEIFVLARESIFCGSFVLAICAVSDRLYYGVWTFPAYHFLHFNIAQSLAVFYGRNDWHYYLSQGLPLLLTTALPFGLFGLWKALRQRNHFRKENVTITYQLGLTVVIFITTLSLVSHKEVRFIYPILPILHVLASQPIVAVFFPPATTLSAISGSSSNGGSSKKASGPSLRHRLILVLVLSVNITAAYYITQVHQSGPLSVTAYLRHEHEKRLLAFPHDYPVSSTSSSSSNEASTSQSQIMTVGFLMPCHSMPWRSHLVHPNLLAWALGCEPPIGLDPVARAAYVDEADRFYAAPQTFLRTELLDPQHKNGPSSAGSATEAESQGASAQTTGHIQEERKSWPEYLVFFEQAEDTLNDFFKNEVATAGSTEEVSKGQESTDLPKTTSLSFLDYHECWRTFNSHWHDDWRRRGDIVVWCRR